MKGKMERKKGIKDGNKEINVEKKERKERRG